ncbi:hypothetical protein VNO78_07005 [Psophocarpus tetragonolobus]|uniref:Uncharacterized protein n=1 Tax=Psophocarpus tetragonolobus TaxID=3891 RepID=A0AAN9SU72_PSOTE
MLRHFENLEMDCFEFKDGNRLKPRCYLGEQMIVKLREAWKEAVMDSWHCDACVDSFCMPWDGEREPKVCSEVPVLGGSGMTNLISVNLRW